jgi:ribonuclease D
MTPSDAATWIADVPSLQRWLDACADASVLGLDTEFMRRDTFHARLALVQLAAAGRSALLDPLAFDAGPVLRAYLDPAAVTCVMHSPSEDIEVLAPLLPQGPPHLFDTQLAAAYAGFGVGLSYQRLVAELTGVALPKDETRSDWLKRPLSDAQCAYAALDVAYLAPLHAELTRRLAARGVSDWFAEDCERLLARIGDEDDPQPQRAIRSAADWPRDRVALLRRLLLWRERMARSLDTPRGWLLDDANAAQLALDPPATLEALHQRTRGQRTLRGAARADLLEQLRRPLTPEEIDATAAVPAALDPAGKRALAAMKAAVDVLALELDLPAPLLAARRPLEAYLETRQWPARLRGWRRAQLEPRLAPLLPD